MKKATNIKNETINEFIEREPVSLIAKAIIDNAEGKKAISLKDLRKQYPKYATALDSIRTIMGDYAVMVCNGVDSNNERKKAMDAFYKELKTVLPMLTYNSIEPIRPQANDFDAVLAMVGTFRFDKAINRKVFIPSSANTFRNNFEKMLSNRLDGIKGKTATEINADRKAKAEAAKAAAKAAREKAKHDAIAEEAKKAKAADEKAKAEKAAKESKAKKNGKKNGKKAA